MEMTDIKRAYRLLRMVHFDDTDPYNAAMAPQEMLEFLAMLAGLKPVYLLGRGFDDENWVIGVKEIADKFHLKAHDGPYWDDERKCDELPSWYKEILHQARPPAQATYICRSKVTLARVKDACAIRRISTREEATLLGYPECCVHAHEERRWNSQCAFLATAERVGQSNAAEMQRLVLEDISMPAETPEEIAALLAVHNQKRMPFTSVYMCEACGTGTGTPASRLGELMRQFASKVDDRLFSEIEAYD